MEAVETPVNQQTIIDLQDEVDNYLQKCGGEDIHVFTDSRGNPSIGDARQFAEALRDVYQMLPNPPLIEQRVNRVFITEAT